MDLSRAHICAPLPAGGSTSHSFRTTLPATSVTPPLTSLACLPWAGCDFFFPILRNAFYLRDGNLLDVFPSSPGFSLVSLLFAGGDGVTQRMILSYTLFSLMHWLRVTKKSPHPHPRVVEGPPRFLLVLEWFPDHLGSIWCSGQGVSPASPFLVAVHVPSITY